MSQGPFRPGVSYRAEGAVNNGEITAVKFRMCGQNIGHWMGSKKDVPNDSVLEGFQPHYFDNIKNISFSDIPFETPVPIMWWRSVYASTNGFAYEVLWMNWRLQRVKIHWLSGNNTEERTLSETIRKSGRIVWMEDQKTQTGIWCSHYRMFQ